MFIGGIWNKQFVNRWNIKLSICLKVEVESERCKDDYTGEEARRKKVMEEELFIASPSIKYILKEMNVMEREVLSVV